MDEAEFNRCCALLGVGPEVTQETLERAYLKKNFALISVGASEARTALREARDRTEAHLKSRPPAPVARVPRPAEPAEPVSATRPGLVGVPPASHSLKALLDPVSQESWLVKVLALPLVLALAWFVNASPLGFFLQGFHVWVHEFGHATVAWLTGHRALPLPVGWTSVEPQRSAFVYFGVLFLLGLMLVAGWRERKIWPIVIPVVVAPVQFYMTWRMPEYRADLWLAFGGVGGEFYLSALFMLCFYVEFPDKFRWGLCRYFFLFIGASSFLKTCLFWQQVKSGAEGIPWGSMVNGEEDGGGDMNILRDDYGWNNHTIIGTYTGIGHVCVVVLAVVYLFFALRLDRLADRLLGRLWLE